jgi:hypothetical protein
LLEDIGNTRSFRSAVDINKTVKDTKQDVFMGMQIDKNIVDLSLAVMETPTRLFQSTKIVTDLNEYKITRFGNPNNRWGIFEGRN